MLFLFISTFFWSTSATSESSDASTSKAAKHYLSHSLFWKMSAIKTHETFHIVHVDDIEFSNEDGEHMLHVKSLMISRQQPNLCQIFTEKENTGSFKSCETRVLTGKIVTISPTSTTTDFAVKAKVGESFQELKLKCQKSADSECCIS